MKIGIIGYGYWGPNITRNFAQLPGCEVVAVAEPRPERIRAIKALYPSVRVAGSADEVIGDGGIDAVAIVSPVSTHFPFAKKALEQGKHVLVEKPMTTSSAQARELIALAAAKGLVLMVDHTFLYTGAVEKMKELVDAGRLGRVNYIDSTRINLGLFQQDVNVLWDLATHDLSIINYLLGELPESVQAIGSAHTPSGMENIAYLVLHYPNGRIAHINCSWISPVKVRTMLVGGDKQMIVYNDIEPTEKVRLYDKGYSVTSDEDKKNVLIDYRHGDVYVPKVHMREALAGMAEDFRKAVVEGGRPRSGAGSGLDVVRILEAAQQSIKARGKEVFL